ncbi:hypothetical protein [Chitinophaga flava]|uniref:Uncharacterized protein n=1 Tax=Chitinophaga flava TaxID=2259036 RepID=A0A365XT48_9BACT|nr:hypothetical protein [Chitinophaga flava]RBL89310.1 hypothetical protein DF182_22575 [Chitinophaga flava]
MIDDNQSQELRAKLADETRDQSDSLSKRIFPVNEIFRFYSFPITQKVADNLLGYWNQYKSNTMKLDECHDKHADDLEEMANNVMDPQETVPNKLFISWVCKRSANFNREIAYLQRQYDIMNDPIFGRSFESYDFGESFKGLVTPLFNTFSADK